MTNETTTQTCPACNGSGRSNFDACGRDLDQDDCGGCGGEGTIPADANEVAE